MDCINKAISVIIPVFNVKKYLRQCIESVQNQSYYDMEIILIDDGSTDGSGEICDEYAETDGRIKVIHQENRGPMSARKTGLEASSSEYVIFADADDWIDADMYEKLMDIMKRYRVDVVISGHINDNWSPENPVWKIHGSYVHVPGLYLKDDLDEEFYSKLIYGSGDYFGWGISPSLVDKLVKKSIIYPYLMRVDERIRDGDDSACIYPMLINVASLYICDFFCYHHIKRADSLCHESDWGYFERIKILQDSMEEAFQKSEFRDVLMPQLDRFILEMFLKNLQPIYHVPMQFQHEQYLFPFEHVKTGSKVVLYGAGKVGREFYKQIAASSYCEIIAWVDSNFASLKNAESGIKAPELIKEISFDYIIIAVLSENAAQEIKKLLTYSYKISKEKIIWSDKYLYGNAFIHDMIKY